MKRVEGAEKQPATKEINLTQEINNKLANLEIKETYPVIIEKMASLIKGSNSFLTEQYLADNTEILQSSNLKGIEENKQFA